jgi:ssDNA-specific exonuclease RecJ
LFQNIVDISLLNAYIAYSENTVVDQRLERAYFIVEITENIYLQTAGTCLAGNKRLATIA